MIAVVPSSTPDKSKRPSPFRNLAFAAVALAIVGGIALGWRADRVGTGEECVGTHLIVGASLKDTSTLLLSPLAGFYAREVSIGPSCTDFKPRLTELKESGARQICVGDSLTILGAPEGDCKVVSIEVSQP
jgi:hypothetical protein